jgi:hypothetical protein
VGMLPSLVGWMRAASKSAAAKLNDENQMPRFETRVLQGGFRDSRRQFVGAIRHRYRVGHWVRAPGEDGHSPPQAPYQEALASVSQDRELLFRRLESWIRWRFGADAGKALVATTGPAALPARVQGWALQHRDAVWQVIWLDSTALLCGLAPDGPEQFAIIQYSKEVATIEGYFSYATDGSWHQT